MSTVAWEISASRRPATHAAGATAAAPIVCIWLLTLCTFSLPGRDGPESLGGIDAIAIVKLGVRCLTLGSLGLLYLRTPRDRRSAAVAWCLFPFALFTAWGVLSVLWSPLRAVSLGQLTGLIAQLMVTYGVAVRCRNERERSRVLQHLSLALLTVSALIAATHLLRPDWSGLDRATEIEVGSTGMVHPTSAGASASLGIVILLAARLLWGWRWVRLLLAPGLMVHVMVLLMANSRMAIGMTVLLAAGLCGVLGQRKLVAVTGVMASMLALAFLTIDPRLELLGSLGEAAGGFLQRGESVEQLTSLTGRTALWDAIWKSIQEAPLTGHGFFVTSSTGLLDVWQVPANRDAHNVLLQVLVTTGVVGLGLFLWSLVRPCAAVVNALRSDPAQLRIGSFLVALGIWYVGWGLLCSSFMGPVQPESVVFYTMLGVALSTLGDPRRVPA